MAHDNRNHNNNQQKIKLDRIELDYGAHNKLFGDIAESWSKQLFNDTKGQGQGQLNKSTQIRTFYDKVLELHEKAEGMDDDTQYKKEVFPFVMMLKSKVAYAKTRGLVSNTFVRMINECVEEASSIEKMRNFKFFFEAVIGFYPKK